MAGARIEDWLTACLSHALCPLSQRPFRHWGPAGPQDVAPIHGHKLDRMQAQVFSDRAKRALYIGVEIGPIAQALRYRRDEGQRVGGRSNAWGRFPDRGAQFGGRAPGRSIMLGLAIHRTYSALSCTHSPPGT